MSGFKKSVLVVLSIFTIVSLGACETVEGWTDGLSQSDEITVSNSEPVSIVPNRLESAPGVRDVPNFPVPDNRDLKIMTSKLSGGSVEIYDLEGQGQTPMGAPVPPVSQDYAGIPMASDPRVTVYPIDGMAAYPGELRPQVYPAQASGREWSGAASAMTPPPVSIGADQRMAIEGGKLSSREGAGVSNIYFPYGSSALDGSDKSVLNNVAETAKFAPVDRVSVEGHASLPTQTDDPVRAKILNLKESLKRATAVSEDLIQKGVPAEKIKTVGWGDTKRSSEREAEQRRVDIFTGAGP